MIVGANWRLENAKSPAAMLQENNPDVTCMSIPCMYLASCCRTHDVYTTNIIGKWFSSQRFPSPNSIGRGLPPRSPSANQGAWGARRELLLGETPRSRRTRGGYVPILGSEIPPYIYNYDNTGTKIVIPRVETDPHGVETPTPPADR